MSRMRTFGAACALASLVLAAVYRAHPSDGIVWMGLTLLGVALAANVAAGREG